MILMFSLTFLNESTNLQVNINKQIISLYKTSGAYFPNVYTSAALVGGVISPTNDTKMKSIHFPESIVGRYCLISRDPHITAAGILLDPRESHSDDFLSVTGELRRKKCGFDAGNMYK